MKRCSRCIVASSMPGLTLDSEGICSYCRDFQAGEIKGENKLLEMIDTVREAGKKYNCIVPVSGGKG